MIKRRIQIFIFSILVLVPIIVIQAAGLLIVPGHGDFSVGKTLSVGVYVSSKDQALNAVSGTINFPADKLELTSLNKSGSVVNFWLKEPSFSNSNGTVHFEGIVLNPGFEGASAKIFTLSFKVKTAGEASLTFGSGSILANDGNATEILKGTGNGQYSLIGETEPTEVTDTTDTVAHTQAIAGATSTAVVASKKQVPVEPQLASTINVNLNNWSTTGKLSADWVLPAGVSGVSYTIDNKANSTPDTQSEGRVSSVLASVADGQWFLHVRYRNKYGWGPVASYAFSIDKTAPKNFIARFMDGNETFNLNPVLFLDAKDAASGLSHFRIDYGAGKTVIASSSQLKDNLFTMPTLEPGQYSFNLAAVDYAGNEATTSLSLLVKYLPQPIIKTWPTNLTNNQVLMLSGVAAPDGLVVIDLRNVNGNIENHLIKADSVGNFNYVANKVAAGDYAVTATLVGEHNQRSLPSKLVNIKVSRFWLGDILNSTFGVVTYYLQALILALMLVLLVVVYRLTKFRKHIIRDAKQAELVLNNSYTAINQELIKLINYLDNIKKKREMTSEEQRVMRELKKRLQYTEQFIADKPEKLPVALVKKAVKTVTQEKSNTKKMVKAKALKTKLLK